MANIYLVKWSAKRNTQVSQSCTTVRSCTCSHIIISYGSSHSANHILCLMSSCLFLRTAGYCLCLLSGFSELCSCCWWHIQIFYQLMSASSKKPKTQPCKTTLMRKHTAACCLHAVNKHLALIMCFYGFSAHLNTQPKTSLDKNRFTSLYLLQNISFTW